MGTGDLSLFINVSDFSISLSPNFATPLENPMRFTQGLGILVDLYYVTPTGNPAAPWTYLDPVDYTNPAICIAQTNSAAPPFLADATTFTYNEVSGNNPAYLEGLLTFKSSAIATALGSSPSLKAIFEVDWVDGARQFIVQCNCVIARSVLFSGVSPNPPILQIFDPTNSTYYSLTAPNGVPTLGAGLVVSGTTPTVFDPVNDVYYPLTAPNGVLTLGTEMSSPGATPSNPSIYDPTNNIFYALTAPNGVLTLT